MDHCWLSCGRERSIAMLTGNSGPVLVQTQIIEEVNPLLSIKCVHEKAVAFRIKTYEPKLYDVQPKQGIMQPKSSVTVELCPKDPKNKKSVKAQPFHIVALQWDGKLAFDPARWAQLERTEKQLQVLSFGKPPEYKLLSDKPCAPTPKVKSSSKFKAHPGVKTEGSEMLEFDTNAISFKSITGNKQSVELTVFNATPMPVAYKIKSNRVEYYAVRPAIGCVGVAEKTKIIFETLPALTTKKFAKDSSGHEFRLLAAKFPKDPAEYNSEKHWAKLCQFYKDEMQVTTFSVNYKGKGKSPTAEETQDSAAITALSQLGSGTCFEKDDLPTKAKAKPKTETPKTATNKHICAPEEVLVSASYKSTFTLTNISKHGIVFKLQSNKGQLMIVKPNKGVIQCNEKAEISVYMDAIQTNIDKTAACLLVLTAKSNASEFSLDDWAKIDSKNKERVMIKLPIDESKPAKVDDTEIEKKKEVKKVKKEEEKKEEAPAILETKEEEFIEVQYVRKPVVAAFPKHINFYRDAGRFQTVAITLMNMHDLPCAFKMDIVSQPLSVYYIAKPKAGVIQAGQSVMLKFSTKSLPLESQLPVETNRHAFKLRLVSWPRDAPTFKQEIWNNQMSSKESKPQKINLMVKIEDAKAGLNYELPDDDEEILRTAREVKPVRKSDVIPEQESDYQICCDLEIEEDVSEGKDEESEDSENITPFIETPLIEVQPEELQIAAGESATQLGAEIISNSDAIVAFIAESTHPAVLSVTPTNYILAPRSDVKMTLVVEKCDSDVTPENMRVHLTAMVWPPSQRKFDPDLWNRLLDGFTPRQTLQLPARYL